MEEDRELLPVEVQDALLMEAADVVPDTDAVIVGVCQWGRVVSRSHVF